MSWHPCSAEDCENRCRDSEDKLCGPHSYIKNLEAKLLIATDALESVEYECPNCTPALKSIIGGALSQLKSDDAMAEK